VPTLWIAACDLLRTLARSGAACHPAVALCLSHRFVHPGPGLGYPALAKLSLQSTAVVDNPQVRAQLVADAPAGVGPAKAVHVGLLLQHQPHWHTYWINPGDSGLATRLEWTLPPGVTAGETQWPVPRKIDVGNLANLGYEGQALLRSTLTISPQFKPQGPTLPVRLHASWLVCNQECIPQEGDFALDLALQGASSTHGALFAQATPTGALSSPLEAHFEGGQLRIATAGLPQAWRGKNLAVFPETAAVLPPARCRRPRRRRARAYNAGKALNGAVCWPCRPKETPAPALSRCFLR